MQKKNMQFFALILAYAGVVTCLPTAFKEIFKTEEINTDHTVVLFVFSGLRTDSWKFHPLPTLSHLRNHGAYAERKIDAFQTESLPSYITMLTGNYPEVHGIMGNKMKHLITKENFDAENTDIKWWKKVNPIWRTNYNNGSSSALCYIPGHDVNFKLNQSMIYTCADKKYADPHKELLTKGTIENAMPFSDRVHFAKTMLNMTENRPTFIAIYFEEPYFSIMKSHGDMKNTTRKALETVELVTKEMLDYIKLSKLEDKVNFIITGESGFTEQPNENAIFIDDYLEKGKNLPHYTVIDDGPIMQIYPKDKKSKSLLLKQLKGAHAHMSVLDGETLPLNYHYTNTNLTAPILIVSDEKWRVYNERVKDNRQVVMGYDGKFESTHTLFIGHGPGFNKGIRQSVIGNVDVYAILCKALKIKPHLHSGNYTIIDKLLKKPQHWIERIAKQVTSSTSGLIAVVIVAMVLLFVTVYLVVCSIYRTVGWCVCPKRPMKVKISTLKKKKNNEKMSGGHLLSEDELSSDFSDTDDELGWKK